MKFNCGPDLAERWRIKKEKLEGWHDFYCLLPRRVDYNKCIWLEIIERKGKYYSCNSGRYTFWLWNYREKK